MQNSAHMSEVVPKRRALLVGIKYEKDIIGDNAVNERYGPSPTLKGPHKDVDDMSKLLTDLYGYEEEQIVVMKDDGVSPNLQPTRTNMIRELSALVHDARPGDRFFFHYAGHTMQQLNESGSEEDGMDECLMPCDDSPTASKIITDNDLHRYLVSPLPVGSHLVAVFDSCHSATLLDLEHIRCNRVYVPWISKGRRKSDTIYDYIVRRNAMVVKRAIYQADRVSHHEVRSRKTSLERMYNTPRSTKHLSILEKSEITSDRADWIGSADTINIPRCDSPAPMFSCTGFCSRPTGSDPNVAEVISLSACEDGQFCWEDDDGSSMTKVLIEILNQDPHPKLNHLMTFISHRLHKAAVRMHFMAREHTRLVRKWEVKHNKSLYRRRTIETHMRNDFQDPQLGSRSPLDMNSLWKV
ncbi:hypothetical protein HGRIS_004864 [Hohenbuehelia grisea]|uniref:Peptidase C14 caspase domain-containing protein n=1 Tax=Hohenbuehelia grisea TaxID=104357 RepID=A0ABR3JEW5_9AGAR